MAYYVLGPGGAKHGPAELHTLNDWIAQGRISPETLVEDMGGTKIPARAIRGLVFAGGAGQTSLASSVLPAPAPLPVGTPLGKPSIPPAQQQINSLSNYVRPGLGTGGSQHNLFLPAADAKWALHGFLSAGGGVLLALALWFTTSHWHFEIGRLTFFALGLPIYGIRSGYIGLNRGDRGRATFVVILNVVAFIAVIGAMILGFSSW